jgi:hypothetical protein
MGGNRATKTAPNDDGLNFELPAVITSSILFLGTGFGTFSKGREKGLARDCCCATNKKVAPGCPERSH